MATFTETFEYANGTIDSVSSSAWLTFDSSDTQNAGVKVAQNAATNDSAAGSMCVYHTTDPATKAQRAEAWVTSFEQGTATYVDIGVGGQSFQGGFPANWAARILGVYARLHWKADGVRTLSIRHRLRGGSDTELASVNLVLAGGIEATGFEGLMDHAGEIEYLQKLRLVVTEEDYGLGCRAFVNEPDDDHPTLFARLGSDFVTPTATSTDYGAWWFGFGSASTSDMLWVDEFVGADYDISTDRLPQTLRPDQVTLAELRDRVKVRYERTANVDLRDDDIDQHLNDEIEQVLNEVGDVAWFMRREDSVAIAPNDRREITCDAKMRRVLGIRDSETGCNVWFRFLRYTTDGALLLQMENSLSRTVLIDYMLRHRQLSQENDVCPIPREHTELVVVGACLRMSEVDRQERLQRTFLARRQVLLGNLKRDMNRHSDQTRTRMDPRPPRMLYRRYGGYTSRYL